MSSGRNRSTSVGIGKRSASKSSTSWTGTLSAFKLDEHAQGRLRIAVQKVIDNAHWTKNVGDFAPSHSSNTNRDNETNLMKMFPLRHMALRIRLLPGIYFCLKDTILLELLRDSWGLAFTSTLQQFRLFLYSWAFNQTERYDHPSNKVFSELLFQFVIELSASHDFRKNTMKGGDQHLYSVRLQRLLIEYCPGGIDLKPNTRTMRSIDPGPITIREAEPAPLISSRKSPLNNQLEAFAELLKSVPSHAPSEKESVFDEVCVGDDSELLMDEEENTLPENDFLKFMRRRSSALAKVEKSPSRAGRKCPATLSENDTGRIESFEQPKSLSRELTLHRPDEVRAPIGRAREHLSRETNLLSRSDSCEARTPSSAHRNASQHPVQGPSHHSHIPLSDRVSVSPIMIPRQEVSEVQYTRMLSRPSNIPMHTLIEPDTKEVIRRTVRDTIPLEASASASATTPSNDFSGNSTRLGVVNFNIQTQLFDNSIDTNSSSDIFQSYRNAKVSQDRKSVPEDKFSIKREFDVDISSPKLDSSEVDASDLFSHKIYQRRRVKVEPAEAHVEVNLTSSSEHVHFSDPGKEDLFGHRLGLSSNSHFARSGTSDSDVFQHKLAQLRRNETSPREYNNHLTRAPAVLPESDHIPSRQLDQDNTSHTVREKSHPIYRSSISNKEPEDDDLFLMRNGPSSRELADLYALNTPKLELTKLLPRNLPNSTFKKSNNSPEMTFKSPATLSESTFRRSSNMESFQRKTRHLNDSGLIRVQKILFESEASLNLTSLISSKTSNLSDDLDLFHDRLRQLRSDTSSTSNGLSFDPLRSKVTSPSSHDADSHHFAYFKRTRSPEKYSISSKSVSEPLRNLISERDTPSFESETGFELNRNEKIEIIARSPSNMNRIADGDPRAQPSDTVSSRDTTPPSNKTNGDDDILTRLGVEAIVSDTSSSIAPHTWNGAETNPGTAKGSRSNLHTASTNGIPSLSPVMTSTQNLDTTKLHDLLFQPEAVAATLEPAFVMQPSSHNEINFVPQDASEPAPPNSQSYPKQDERHIVEFRDSLAVSSGSYNQKYHVTPSTIETVQIKEETLIENSPSPIINVGPLRLRTPELIPRSPIGYTRELKGPRSPLGKDPISTALSPIQVSPADLEFTHVHMLPIQSAELKDNPSEQKVAVISGKPKKKARFFDPPTSDESDSPDIFEHRMKKPRLATLAPNPFPFRTDEASGFPIMEPRVNSDKGSEFDRPFVDDRNGNPLGSGGNTISITSYDQASELKPALKKSTDSRTNDPVVAKLADNEFLRRSHRVRIPRALARCIDEWMGSAT